MNPGFFFPPWILWFWKNLDFFPKNRKIRGIYTRKLKVPKFSQFLSWKNDKFCQWSVDVFPQMFSFFGKIWASFEKKLVLVFSYFFWKNIQIFGIRKLEKNYCWRLVMRHKKIRNVFINNNPQNQPVLPPPPPPAPKKKGPKRRDEKPWNCGRNKTHLQNRVVGSSRIFQTDAHQTLF